jgi:O-acetyl-ADP-ribose deacetylase (regulator of RNase III)
MTVQDPGDGVRFGRTLIAALVADDVVSVGVEALLYPANERGVLPASAGSLRHRAGAAVEREAMERAPLPLGGVIITGAGDLAALGIKAIVHAVVARQLGDPARLDLLRRAIDASLAAADGRRIRSLALPPLIAIDGDGSPLDEGAVGALLVEPIVAYLRRSTTRLERVVLTYRYPDHAERVREAIVAARQRLWVLTS